MDLEQRLRASLVAPDPGAGFSARVMARLRPGSRRRGGRLIVVGGVLAMAAAAGMLAWQFSPSPGPLAEHATPPVLSEPASPEVQQPALTDSQPVPESPAAMPPGMPTASPSFSVLLLAPRQEVQDAALHRRVETFQAALGDELRKVPGLLLRVSPHFSPEAGDNADFVVGLTSLATSTSPTGGVRVQPTEGGNALTVMESATGNFIANAASSSGDVSASASYGAAAVNGVVSMVVANRMSGLDVDYNVGELTAGGGASLVFSGDVGNISGVSGEGGIVSITDAIRGETGTASWVEIKVSPRASAASRYTLPVLAGDSPAQLAAELAEKLRLQVFPVDAGYQQRVLARLANAGADALPDLLPLLVVDSGKRLEPATLQAFFRYVANQPAMMRARVWQTLGRTDNPQLVAAMIDSLRQDTDQQVRLAALANLEAHHAANADVRTTLEALDRSEADPGVRAAVRWVLHGESQWRADVMAALQDPGLSYEARLAPLLVRGPSDLLQSWQWAQTRRNLLEQDQMLESVLALVSENLRNAGLASVTGQALRLLGNIEQAAVVDLFVSLLGDASLPMDVTTAVSTWAVNHMQDPRVRAAMPQLEQFVPSALIERMNELSGPGARVIEVVPVR
jgi:hypothetical protein